MSLHVFGTILTNHGVAANNRGETQGNISTLQKLLWRGEVHSTVSAEAIRWAIRYYWQREEIPVNRVWVDEKEDHDWKDANWKGWNSEGGKTYIDDDLLGYMKAEGAKKEGEKGKINKRRGVLEIARAISTTAFVGDITFNAKSGEKGYNSLYGTEIHATRYQYSFALTPERLREPERALLAIDAIANLGEVAGNHSRFLFDFSPESIVLRLTEDPAPRLLYCFEEDCNGCIRVPRLIKRIESEDIEPEDLYIGGAITEDEQLLEKAKGRCFGGVKKVVGKLKDDLKRKLGV
jgi:CRISPR-associated protein Cst2